MEWASQSYSTPYGTYREVRLYVDQGVVKLRAGAADLSQVSLQASDATYSAGSGGLRAQSQGSFDYLKIRTSHELTVEAPVRPPRQDGCP